MTLYTVRGGRGQYVGQIAAENAEAAIKQVQRSMTERSAKIIGRLSAKVEPKFPA